MCSLTGITHAPYPFRLFHSILGCIHHPNAAAYRPRMLDLSKCIRHRGPDWSGCVVSPEGSGTQGSILCHERLAIVGVGELRELIECDIAYSGTFSSPLFATQTPAPNHLSAQTAN